MGVYDDIQIESKLQKYHRSQFIYCYITDTLKKFSVRDNMSLINYAYFFRQGTHNYIISLINSPQKTQPFTLLFHYRPHTPYIILVVIYVQNGVNTTKVKLAQR